MPRRRPDLPWPRTTALALDSAAATRRACVQVCTETRIDGPAYAAAHRVMTAIDGLAEVLAGDGTLFHEKPHAIGSGPKGPATA
jgi:phosphopantothenoylcysteine synthetase/decarboxylase